MRHICGQVDRVRIDHFRGFAAYWEIPASEPTAMVGRWVEGRARPGSSVVRGAGQPAGDRGKTWASRPTT